MKIQTTPPIIVTMLVVMLLAWTDPSVVFSKRETNHQKNLRQEAQYLTILEQTPGAIQPRLQLAQLYMKKNNFSKAITHFEKALAAGSELPEIYIGIAFCQQQQGKIDEAIQTCHQCITVNPKNSEVHLRLGNLYHLKGRNDETEREYSIYRQLSADL